MLSKEQIEFMKTNRVPWELLTDDEKELFWKNNDNLLMWNGEKFVKCTLSTSIINTLIIYRLRPDWQPEEAEVKIPEKIESYMGWFDGYQVKGNTETESKINEIIDYLHSIEKRITAIQADMKG